MVTQQSQHPRPRTSGNRQQHTAASAANITMGVKADLKMARARMQAGEPAEALSMIQTILDSSSPELQDAQTKYAVLLTSGLAGLAAEDFGASEHSFRQAAESLPDAPQAWKGLIDCFDRAGKVASLPECLARAAEIAEVKGNFARARPLRLRLGQVLDRLGRPEEALEALMQHLEKDPDAVGAAAASSSGGAGGGDDNNSAMVERLSLVLLAAVLEASMEDAAVARRVEKRLVQDSGISSASAVGGSAAQGLTKRRSTLAFGYRAKALAKDDEQGGPVASRFANAMRALEEAADGGGLPSRDDDADSSHTQQQTAWKQLAARFYRLFLRRAVQRAECGGGGVAAWKEAMDACALVRKTVGGAGWDERWAATITLLLSSYQRVDGAEIRRVAEDGAGDGQRPWLLAESCLHLAGVALFEGDGLKADSLLQAAAAARGQRVVPKDAWAELSGPGNDWRELSLRCLANERLGYPGADRDPAVALSRVDAALAAFDASCGLRGAPVGEHGGVVGRLLLARASLLLTLGRLDDARLAAQSVSADTVHKEDDDAARDTYGGGGDGVVVGGGVDDNAAPSSQNSAASRSSGGRRGAAFLHCRALCVASDIDLAEGNIEQAKGKLREVLEADGSCAEALSKLGWLLLGVGGVRGVAGERDVEAARLLLERAAVEEPACSAHAFRLARYLEFLMIVFMFLACLLLARCMPFPLVR